MADYSITGDTKLDTSGFTKGVSSMTVAAGNLISDLTKTAATKLAGLAKSSVSVGMNFDASMSQVAATMGKSVDEIDNLTKVAKEMGSTTKFTATQAADALNYLALAGYDADKAAEVLPSVLNLAAAGGMDLAYASNLATKAMASLGIEATKSNLDEFGNKLAVGASKAGATVSELGEAILTVGGTAANLKGGTTELVTALGKLADVGAVGAEGGTHLRNIILSLQSPTDDATKLMQKLGLQVYDAQGNMRGLNEILGDLNGALDGMTQGDKDSIINALFNKTDLAAVNGLLAAQGEQWDTLAAQIDSADGAMGQMAETQQDNLLGVMTSLGSAFEGLKLAVYNEMEPSLTDLGNYGIECVRTLTTALSEGGPEAMLAAAGEIISDLASGIAEQLPGLMTTGVEIITQLAQSLTDTMPAMLDIGAEVLAALAQGIINATPALLTSATEIIAEFMLYLGDHADEIMDAGMQLLESLIIGITDNLPQLITSAAGLIAKWAAALIAHLPDILKCGAAMLTTLVDGIFYSLENLAEAALACVAKLVGVWDGSMDEWGNIGTNIVKGLWEGIKSGWNGLLAKVKSLVDLLPDIAKKALGIHSPSKVFDEIGVNTCKGLAQGLARGTAKVKDAAETVVASVTDTATRLVDGVTTVTQTVTETMADGSTRQKQTITETSRQLIDGVEKTVKTVTERAADGSESVQRSIEAVRDVVAATKDTQTRLVDGVQVTVEKTTQLLADGSRQISTVTTSTGTEIIDGAERTVQTVTTIAADGTKTVSKTIEDAGPQYASAGEMLTTQLRTKLTEGWEQIRSDIQTDALGAVKTLATALKNGDLESLGLWAASYFWHACTQKQQEQITALAMGALDQLGSALNGVLGNLSQLAMGLVAKFVPAAAAATGGQTALNLAMEANPILLVISLIGMLVGALLNFSGKNKEVAAGFQSVWAGVEDFMSYIFEGLLRIVAAGIEGFVLLINGLIGVYNLVAKLWGGQVDYISNPAWDYADKIAADRKARQAERKKQTAADPDPAPGSGSGSGGSSPGTGSPGTPTPDKDLTDAVEANTAALLAANSKLAQMVRQANSLVLSDNMAVSRTVAASGTAQIAAAANQYHREGDTNITQNIYSKAQTAADLQREARWEADRAKAQKR